MSCAEQRGVENKRVVAVPRKLPNGKDSFRTNYYTHNYWISTVTGAPGENYGMQREQIMGSHLGPSDQIGFPGEVTFSSDLKEEDLAR